MAKKLGRATWLLDSFVCASAFASSAGKKESEGPFGKIFDYIDPDDRFGQQSFEEAESAMQGLTLQTAIEKRGIKPNDIDLLFGGDLLNQCIGTSFALKDFRVPFLGIYGACSTISEGLLLSSLSVDAGIVQRCAAITSSHFCTAERQYRFPLEYGGQRTPNSQWTATACGAVILEKGIEPPFIKSVTAGTIEDKGIVDANNMGAAMAPAAYSTIKQFFTDTELLPDSFDYIVTGDLGLVGSRLLIELAEADGLDIRSRHLDCGKMLFDTDRQDVHAGGSGCGCAASMLCGHFLPLLKSGRLKNILFAATGALLSPTSTQQGKSIPGISHLAWISGEA